MAISASRARGERGFTLFEVLIVLAIVGLVSAIMAPMIFKGVSGTRSRAAAYEIAAALRQARGEAVATNADVALMVDPERGAYALEAAKPKMLAGTLRLSLYAAQSEQLGTAIGGIRFYPDGSATGGQITVRDETTGYHVDVDWLTGRVSVVEATAP